MQGRVWEEDMAEDKTIIELAPILNLPPVNTEQMEPYALKRYLGLLQELYKEVPTLYLLNEEDLTDDERAERKEYTDNIVEWVEKCNKDAGQATLMVYPYSMVIFYRMSDLKALLKTALDRKVGKVKQEAEQKRRLAAQKERDERAWLAKIEEQARRKQAEKEQEEFLQQINDTIKTFKKELSQIKKPNFSYPAWLANYHPNLWCVLELPTTEKVNGWAAPHILKRVPQALKNFVCWDIDWQVLTLPYAKYEVVGVPCLTWCFNVSVMAKVNLRLVDKTFTKEFHSYEYQMKIEAEDLGCFYLGPIEWDDQEGFSTPLALLSLVATGKVEGDGIEVMEIDGSSMSFYIRGYDEAFTEIDERFRQFLIDMTKDKTLSQGLLASGVIDELTAQLVEQKAKLPLPHAVGPQASAGQTIDDNSDVIATLEAMGYKKGEIQAGMDSTHISPAMSLEEKVKAVLKNVSTIHL